MANAYAILNELIRSNAEVAAFQKDKLNELAAKDFPFSDSKKLIIALKEINEEILNTFDELRKEFQQLESSDDVTQYQELQNDLSGYSKLLWNVNQLVYFVEQSAREHVSQSTVFLISYLTKRYAKHSSFFLTPLSEHNFLYRNIGRYLKDLIVDSIPNAQNILSKLPQNFSVLSFPEIHRDNILANILLAHEVGHFIVNFEGLESKVNTKVSIDNKLFSDYLQRVGSTEVKLDDKQRTLSEFFEMEKIHAQLLEILTRSIESWIRELLSDMIGFRLCGPVFIIALADELLTMFPHGLSNDRYPSTSYRIRIILNEIEGQKFMDAIENTEDRIRISQILQKIKDYTKTPSIKSDELLLDIVSNAVEAVESVIIQTANEATKGIHYTPQQFGKDISKLIVKLDELTPPCEIKDGEPANIISILNAGMIYKMTWIQDGKYKASKREDVEDTERTINALVLRSIEMSILEQQMLDHLKK